MRELTIGATYYIPEEHQLIQVRGLDSGVVLCGGKTIFLSDSRTTIEDYTCNVSETLTWTLVTDPAEHSFLSQDVNIGAWRVVEESLVNKASFQKELTSVVNRFKTVPIFQNVYLFGSVARNGTGNDIDLIATVDEDLFAEWVEAIWAVIDFWSSHKRDRSTYFNRGLRNYMTTELTGLPDLCDSVGFRNVLGMKGYPIKSRFVPVDTFLFPHNWLDRLEELQKLFPHDDPDFMMKISKDAVLL